MTRGVEHWGLLFHQIVEMPLNNKPVSTTVSFVRTNKADCRIYLDEFTTHTGVTRFLDERLPCIIDKYGSELNVRDYSSYEYILSEKEVIDGFDVVFCEAAFDKWRLDMFRLPKLLLKPGVFVHQRTNLLTKDEQRLS